jgi:hypothetical protein
MANAISYALWGKDQPKHRDCFDFESFLRTFAMCLRMNRLLYPDWETVVHVNAASAGQVHDLCKDLPMVRVVQMRDDVGLCHNMLWRMAPIFQGYDRVLCRDTDSPATWRERAMVQEWIDEGTSAHTINDSVGHGILMMGGLVGFCSRQFRERTGWKSYEQMVKTYGEIDMQVKGADQTWLNRMVAPYFLTKGSEDCTQHFISGYGNTFLNHWHDEVPKGNLPFLDETLQDSNDICGHCGAAGYYETAMFKFLRRFEDTAMFEDMLRNEREFNKKYDRVVFHWAQD